jgi:hypothetical protein
MKKTALIIGMLFCMASLVGAQDIPLIEPQVVNGIKFISGGVGKREREAMTKAFTARDYNLKIVFAAQTGQYLALIPIRITDTGGRVLLETKSMGPWFFVKLPAGTYKVSAIHESQEKTAQVNLHGGGMDTVRFYWKYEEKMM